ncbi:MAG: WYL domain-containing protein [Deltaproteobacteria bacterium]|nr:WYL domain-containing protein [Deltaproteobacteria bacterium]
MRAPLRDRHRLGGPPQVGQRTSSETLANIVVAFMRQPTWAQAELARATGVTPRTVKRILEELALAGWPLEREDDHPHVYWSVPRRWLPAAVPLDREQVGALLHVLLRVPPSRERTQLLDAVAGHAPATIHEALQRVIPPKTSDAEEAHLPALLDGLVTSTPVRMRYWSASRGAFHDRTVSVQRVLPGPPTRFVAWCHRAEALRWFRLDGAATLAADASAAFQQVDDADVDAMIQESVDGFRGPSRIRVAFFVRDPDARWVIGNLPDGLVARPDDGGVLVEAETAGLLPVARYVVGLGAAAECRTPELLAAVRELAEGALSSGTREGQDPT